MTATRSALAWSLPGAWRTGVRAGGIILIALLQLTILDRNFDSRDAVAEPAPELWVAVNQGIKGLALMFVFGAVAFALTALARGAAVWRHDHGAHGWGRWLLAESALFVAMTAALPLFQQPAAQAPWLAFGAWIAAGFAMLYCAARALAPAPFWRAFLAQKPSDYAVALGCGAAALAAYIVAQDSWRVLSAGTLQAAYFILQSYEPAATMDLERRLLGAGDFQVSIEAACSGYEGIGLVLTMLGAYLFAFRRDLRFPHVLALLPIGVAAIWCSNALRIALLVSLGAHVSPDMALNGFHAQAGWVMFLAVTVSLMLAAHHAPFFRRDAVANAAGKDPAMTLAAALLLPFAALMGARAVSSMFGEHAYWPSVVLMVLPAAAIWRYRAAIVAQTRKAGWESWLVGLVVGALWIVTAPAGPDLLGPWLGVQSEPAAAGWLALRLIGFVLIVPIAEELAFRGYLHRALVKRRFEQAAPAAFGWLAFLVTSLVFGAMHGRWLAGALAGAAFALTLYRSKTLAGPVAAHVAANGLIAAYAVAMERWALL